MKTLPIAAVCAAFLCASSAIADDHLTKSPPGASAYFIEPVNGAVVRNPVVVKFGLSGMGVAPAGVEKAKTGHHHLLINKVLEEYDQPIPSDEQHMHFGGGQTETSITLPAGTHTLQIIVADHNHVPHVPPVESARITVTVK